MPVTPLNSQRPVNVTLIQDVEEIFAEWVTRYFDGAHTYGVEGLDVHVEDRGIPECELLLGQDRPKNNEGLTLIHLIFNDMHGQHKGWHSKAERAEFATQWNFNALVHAPVQGGDGSVRPRWEARWVASVLRDILAQEDDPKEELIRAGVSQIKVNGFHEVPVEGYDTFQVLATFQTRT